MLQALLEERFALKLRYEEQTNDVLGLVADRRDGTLGPKVRKWDGTCPAVMRLSQQRRYADRWRYHVHRC